MNSTSTQFGFEKVTPEEKAERVDQVFTQVSSVYDHMNDWMSLGLHHRWKRHAITALGIESHHTVADIACGSGDISELITQKPFQRLFCIDPNAAMLEQCRQRLSNHTDIVFVQSPAESLILPTSINRAIISFGLRNFADPELGLQQIFSHLKPGGKLVILEFNPPQASLFKTLYPQYLNHCLPFLGKHIANDEPSYQYLADSIMTQPMPEDRIQTLSDIGYQMITYSPIQLGIVGLFEAYRCP